MPILDQKYRTFAALGDREPSLGAEANYQARFNSEISRVAFGRISAANRDPNRWIKIARHSKSYSHETHIPLENAESELLKNALLKDVILDRHATRSFANQPMSFSELSELLSIGYGVNPRRSHAEPGRLPVTQRTVPSGGCRLPLEIYPVVINVEGLERGFYHYNVAQSTLETVRLLEDPAAILRQAGYNGDRTEIETASVVLIITTIFERTTLKYGARGVRFAHLDAGHASQNIWLTATGLGLDCAAYGGGFDSQIAKLLGLNSADESLMLSLLIGKPKDKISNLPAQKF